ncbi:MAG: secondary thiamine-phosphate synthase enzyme YjbQ [Candidatus Thermoplasmatota archaeon]
MAVYSDEIKVNTKGENDIVNLTEDIEKIVKKSKIKEGICCIFNPGSTGSVTTIEYEPGLKKDFPDALKKIAPKDQYYTHHETWHDDNGRSHVKASLLGPSITLPFQNNKLIHGTWQQIVFIELDTRKSRQRNIIVQLVGE